MTGLEPRTSGVGSDRSINCATTTALLSGHVLMCFSTCVLPLTCNQRSFFKNNSFIFNFLFHNSHNIFDRQMIVSNQINQIESWRKHICCTWVQKRVCHNHGSNSLPRAWRTIIMIRAKCDTSQLFSCPSNKGS